METDKYQQTTKPFKVVASVPKEQQLSIKKTTTSTMTIITKESDTVFTAVRGADMHFSKKKQPLIADDV